MNCGINNNWRNLIKHYATLLKVILKYMIKKSENISRNQNIYVKNVWELVQKIKCCVSLLKFNYRILMIKRNDLYLILLLLINDSDTPIINWNNMSVFNSG